MISSNPHEVYFTRLYIAASALKVWEALVQPEIASRYYLAPLLILEPRAGGKIIYGFPDRPVITGQVRIFQEGKTLEHTFAFISPDGCPGEETVVTYTLEAVGKEITCLELQHTGFTSKESQSYHDVSSGWPTILSSLKTFLETGHPIAWPRN